MLWNRSYPTLLLLGLTVAVAATLGVGTSTSAASFNAYNPGWDGTSELRATVEESETDLTIAQTVNAYSQGSPERTVSVVLSPADSYDNPSTVRQFVQSGGTLVIAEDYGPGGNELLEAVGAEARINDTQLRDERNAGPSPAFPVATPATNHTYTRNVNSVLLNRGGTVEPANATVLLHSSQFSYLDQNENGRLDTDETLARHPVMTVEQVGDGEVVTISDPSIFVNAMLTGRNNRELLENIAGTHERMLFDVSQTSGLPVLVQLQLLLQQSGAVLVAAGTVSVFVLFGLLKTNAAIEWVGRQRSRDVDRPSLTTEEITAGIRERHPEWDDHRVQRVTDSLMSYHRQSGTND